MWRSLCCVTPTPTGRRSMSWRYPSGLARPQHPAPARTKRSLSDHLAGTAPCQLGDRSVHLAADRLQLLQAGAGHLVVGVDLGQVAIHTRRLLVFADGVVRLAEQVIGLVVVLVHADQLLQR